MLEMLINLQCVPHNAIEKSPEVLQNCKLITEELIKTL